MEELRLVGHEDARSRRPLQGPVRIGAGQAEATGHIVGDTGHGQVAAPHRQHHGLVLQQGDAVSAQDGPPGRQVGVIFMVARAGEDAQRRPQVGHGREVLAPQGGAAVHKVSREQDDVRPEGIGPVHHGPGPLGGEVAADVQVRELGHAQAVQGGRQAGQDDLLRADIGDAQCRGHGHDGHHQGHQQQGGHLPVAAGQGRKARTQAARQPPDEADAVPEQREQGQQEEEHMRHARADQYPARQLGIEGGVEQGKNVQAEAHQQHQQGQQHLERPFAAQGQHAADQHVDAKDGRDDLEHRQGAEEGAAPGQAAGSRPGERREPDGKRRGIPLQDAPPGQA